MRIDGVCEQLSPKLWTLEGKLPLSPDVNGFRETGDPDVDGMCEQLSPKLWTLEGKLPLSPDVKGFLETGDPDVGVELGGPDGELTNRLDMVSPGSPDSLCAPIE